ncbi:hypothetical protein B296_00031869 [Ensete ventricosum]|uniref:WRKY domain-containing protein n=1 Tax=Ensete ventricosum TaxID=4639 RepID=A0A426XCN2_ENSVE|nr:hypothetical protein B296_00031869 [Ensete ventricosum]
MWNILDASRRISIAGLADRATRMKHLAFFSSDRHLLSSRYSSVSNKTQVPAEASEGVKICVQDTQQGRPFGGWLPVAQVRAEGRQEQPPPQSYYRCTSVTCGIKKRVERSSDDPAVVVTTYEGQHTHPSPIVPCGAHHVPLCPLPLLPAEPSMPPPLGFGISLSVNSNEFQFSLLRSYLESPCLILPHQPLHKTSW